MQVIGQTHIPEQAYRDAGRIDPPTDRDRCWLGAAGLSAALLTSTERPGPARAATPARSPLQKHPASVPFDVPLGSVVADWSALRGYGFIGDGQSHPLSSIKPAWSLARWQAVYPHACALSDEIAWCALHGVIDAAATTSLSIELPACVAVLSRPAISGAAHCSFRGVGAYQTRPMFQDSAGWIHGSTAMPSSCSLSIREVGIFTTSTNTDGGLSIRFAGPVGIAQCLTLRDVILHDWARVGVKLVNPPRGVHVENVVACGPEGLAAGAAFIIASTPEFMAGCYSLTWINALTADYIWGWNYKIESPLEGNVFISCRHYNGWGLVRADCTAPDYYSLLWEFFSCDWGGAGLSLSMVHCRDVRVWGGYWKVAPTCEPNPLDQCEIRVLDFQGCVGVMLLAPGIEATPGIENYGCIHLDAECANCIVDAVEFGCFFTALSAMKFEHNRRKNTISELPSIFDTWWGGPKILDPGDTQKAALLGAKNYSGTVDFDGRWMLSGFHAGTADAKAHLYVPFPTRPDSSRAFFISDAVLVVLLGAQNARAAEVVPSVAAVTNAGFTAAFPQVTAGATMRINYIATGY